MKRGGEPAAPVNSLIPPFRLFSFQASSLSPVSLAVFASSFHFPGHGDEDSDEFIGFLQQPVQALGSDVAIIAEEFEPEDAFIGFLGALVDLRDELGIGAGTGMPVRAR